MSEHDRTQTKHVRARVFHSGCTGYAQGRARDSDLSTHHGRAPPPRDENRDFAENGNREMPERKRKHCSCQHYLEHDRALGSAHLHIDLCHDIRNDDWSVR
ncbi:hypothetical protein QVD17_11935 [Tagetes erecta]|uniref:Uncharacterized protein n=1 Tax=Tagetes erecta TaxID=13708 RepID=A0AAD8KVC4_TARER|nr:hypothetical protein QVD17_11935 [Tagetes erecta]